MSHPFEHISHPGKRAFLVALSICGRRTVAEKSAGVARGLSYTSHWTEDQELQAGIATAMGMYAGVLEEEAFRRAMDGDREYQFTARGEPKRHPEECVCGHNARDHLKDVQTQERFTGPCAGTGPEGPCDCEAYLGAPYYLDKRSDTMLIFTMKGMMPEKYGDRVELRGALAGLDISRLPHHLISRLAAGENPLEVLSSAAGEAIAQLGPGVTVHEGTPPPDTSEPAPDDQDAGSESEEA